MRLASIASGSSGNCIYVGSESTHILVDTGTSKKKIEEGLNALQLSLKDVDAVFVTHEHSDHIAGLHTILKKYDIPVYATAGTIQGIHDSDKKHEMDEAEFHIICADEKLTVGDMSIAPMRISHDANEPVAYRFRYGEHRVGIATDLGRYNEYTVECLQNMDALLLEANHDVHMLQVGPYPYQLKRRILGDRGHLSNEKAGELLCRLLNDHMKAIILGHLSEQNNLPELAYETVRVEIEMGDNPYHGTDIPLMVADRKNMSSVIEI